MSKSTKQYFTQSGFWTCPNNVTDIILIGCGGGGAGGYGANGINGSNANAGGGGGGGGAQQQFAYVSVIPGTTYPIIIGAGGLGAITITSNGGAGGDTIFGTLATFYGASGGGGGSNVNSAGISVAGAPYKSIGTSNSYASNTMGIDYNQSGITRTISIGLTNPIYYSLALGLPGNGGDGGQIVTTSPVTGNTGTAGNYNAITNGIYAPGGGGLGGASAGGTMNGGSGGGGGGMGPQGSGGNGGGGGGGSTTSFGTGGAAGTGGVGGAAGQISTTSNLGGMGGNGGNANNNSGAGGGGGGGGGNANPSAGGGGFGGNGGSGYLYIIMIG